MSDISNKTIRKFINSAIYIEKPLTAVSSSENTSVSSKYSQEDLHELQIIRTKRCTCSANQKSCPCHYNVSTSPRPHQSPSTKSPLKLLPQTVKISSSTSSSSSDQSKTNHIKTWIAKKQEERKKKEEKEKIALEQKAKARQTLLEQERNNFRQWLMNKKRQDMEGRKKKERDVEMQQLKDLEREKKLLENELNFRLWLKRKEDETLERKMKEQVKIIDGLHKKEEQEKQNERAFEQWLKVSKNKQKPIPLNRGIQSLCSSTSVTYINPNPWNPVA